MAIRFVGQLFDGQRLLQLLTQSVDNFVRNLRKRPLTACLATRQLPVHVKQAEPNSL
jgi:hypothetical protein